jgi:adenylosuccinate lyase
MFYKDAIKKDKAFSSKLTEKEIDAIFSPEKHLGASPAIISNVEKTVQKTIKKFI